MLKVLNKNTHNLNKRTGVFILTKVSKYFTVQFIQSTYYEKLKVRNPPYKMGVQLVLRYQRSFRSRIKVLAIPFTILK
jgi:hypothetical protein